MLVKESGDDGLFKVGVATHGDHFHCLLEGGNSRLKGPKHRTEVIMVGEYEESAFFIYGFQGRLERLTNG